MQDFLCAGHEYSCIESYCMYSVCRVRTLGNVRENLEETFLRLDFLSETISECILTLCFSEY